MSTQGHLHGEHLSAYIDGMLDVGRTRAVAEHLRACAPCRASADRLEQTKALLRRLPAPPPPGAEFWAASYRRLRVDDHERARTRRPVWASWLRPEQAPQRRWAVGLGAAAALGALLAVPLTHTPGPAPLVRPAPPAISAPVRVQAPAQDVSPDVDSLVESHTDSVSCLPLADPDRQKMIAADAQQSPDAQQVGDAKPEAAGYADLAF